MKERTKKRKEKKRKEGKITSVKYLLWNEKNFCDDRQTGLFKFYKISQKN